MFEKFIRNKDIIHHEATDSSLNKIITKVKKYIWFNYSKERVLIAIIENPNVKRETVCEILKYFNIHSVTLTAIESPHFDDDMFQIIRHYNDNIAIDIAISSNKLLALSLISLGTHENEWIRKHALSKLSRMPHT